MKYHLIDKYKEFNYDNLSIIEKIFLNRGFDSTKQINEYFHLNNTVLEDSYLLDNIDKGINLLLYHIVNNNKIFLQVDSDVDGYTSSAYFINYMHRIFPYHVENNFIFRVHDGKEHGLIESTIPEEVKLVIAIDSSSNDYEEHKKLKERGIDVLIVDHHEAEKVSENACVINNQLSNYPNKALSAVGVIYKVCKIIDKKLNKNYADKDLDLVALGLVADMMDIRVFETRYLIEEGLKEINNPFIKAMAEKNAYSIGDELTPMGMAFYIAPLINATVRVGNLKDKILLFNSLLNFKGEEIVKSTLKGAKETDTEKLATQAARNCTNLKRKQEKIKEKDLIYIEQIIQEKHLLNNKILLVLIKDNKTINGNLKGLIANQLVSKYHRPVLILTYIEETNMYEGSGRNYDFSDFHNFKDMINSCGFCEYGEGHQSAFGCGIKPENVKGFIEYTNQLLDKYDFTTSYEVDLIIEYKDLIKFQNAIGEIGNLNRYYGQNIPEPLVAIKNIPITKDNLYLMSENKKPTIKITTNSKINFIKFHSSRQELEELEKMKYITIIGRCNNNEWMGKVTPQILVKDYEEQKIYEYIF